jgi:hypothetical protein
MSGRATPGHGTRGFALRLLGSLALRLGRVRDSFLNRIEAQFTALRYFALDGSDHESHRAQARMTRRYIAWRDHNAHDRTLRELVKRANVA